MVASVDPVQIHEAGFYEFGAKRFDRYLLTRRKRAGEATFREFCDEIARQLTAMGLTVVDCEARPSEGEGVGAYLTQTVRIDGARDEAPCTLVLTDDDDAISYGGGLHCQEGFVSGVLHQLASVGDGVGVGHGLHLRAPLGH